MTDEAILTLFRRQVRRYTSGEHSSLSTEEAGELLNSVIYTLSMSPAGLYREDRPDVVYLSGLREIERELSVFDGLYADCCLHARDFGNLSYAETLRSIGAFPKRYDRLYFAHLIPCDIDYQLCRPVSEELFGVSYVNQYLRCLRTENDFLSRFSTDRAEALLLRCCPDHRGLLINLYEPAAATALGLSLAGGDVYSLLTTPDTRKTLCGIFEICTAGEAQRKLRSAADDLSAKLSLDGNGRDYLSLTADGLVPRILASLDLGLAGVFQ